MTGFLNNLWQFLTVSYPNIIAVLVGCLIASKFLPRRNRYLLRVVLSFLGVTVFMFVCDRSWFPPDYYVRLDVSGFARSRE